MQDRSLANQVEVGGRGAATAEHEQLVLLHYDRDFETVARVTGQPTAWVAEPGDIA